MTRVFKIKGGQYSLVISNLVESVEDFVRYFSLQVHNPDSMKIALLLSCGDGLKESVDRVCFHQPDRVEAAMSHLIRIGFLRFIPDDGEDTSTED